MTVQDEISRLRKEIDQKRSEADRLQRLAEAFPDLQKFVGRWEKVAYYSASVNPKVERFDLRHNCGCCNDSPLELWPYLETPDGNVYSDPPMFRIGERYWRGGDRPYHNWKQKLQEAGIPETIIGAVSMYFEKERESRIEAASDVGDAYEEEDETC